MHDLTKGSIVRNLLQTASFMLVAMVFQTLYFLVDLYFVGKLGRAAVAAVSLSGNLMFLVLALTQMLAVGTTALVAHATGRKDRDEASLVFNQSQVLSFAVGVAFLLVIPAYLMSRAAGFALHWIWYLSVAVVAGHMLLNLALLGREFRRKLAFTGSPQASAMPAGG